MMLGQLQVQLESHTIALLGVAHMMVPDRRTVWGPAKAVG